MLRIRFHGRGGHGVKTASRIVGTAAFLSGFYAQDSPIYGAERRGAAVAAYTRIDTQPIRERGAVAEPDLILVADETLLADPAAGVRVGCEFASALLVNSGKEGTALATELRLPCPILTLDLTAVVLAVVGRGSAQSAVLGAAACALAGLGPLERVLEAVQRELVELGLEADELARNLEAARRVYADLSAVPLRPRLPASGQVELHCPTLAKGAASRPIILAVGNAAARHTGRWRVFRPVIDQEACTRCGVCFALCPDGAMTLDERAYPVIDYENCKGCMMCYQECPVHCISERQEVQAW